MVNSQFFCIQQDETERRHKERLEQVREKAFEMSVLKHSTDDHNEAPRLVPYESNKFCTACKILVSFFFLFDFIYATYY